MTASTLNTPLDHEQDVLQIAASLLDELNPHFEGRCILLVDPVLRPPKGDDPLAVVMEEHPSHAARLQSRNLDQANDPILIELDVRTDAGRQALIGSVNEALLENTPDELATGQGRRICGWLASSAPLEHVARHLGAVAIQNHASGNKVLLRSYDPAVAEHLWPLLLPRQQDVLWGPVAAWWFIDGNQQLRQQQRTGPRQSSTAQLGLQPQQWQVIDLIGPLNRALLLARQEGRQIVSTDLAVARAALQRAQASGFSDAQDLADYAVFALLVHPHFDLHPKVRPLLAQRPPGAFFTGLVADLTEADWQLVAASPAGRNTPAAPPSEQ